MTGRQLALEILRLPQEQQELDVMSVDQNNSGKIWQFYGVNVCEVKDDDEYPADYNMRKGYRFIRLG